MPAFVAHAESFYFFLLTNETPQMTDMYFKCAHVIFYIDLIFSFDLIHFFLFFPPALMQVSKISIERYWNKHSNSHFPVNDKWKEIHPCISCQSNNTPSSWNSGSIALTLFPLRILWQRTLQGCHVQVVACHWFSGPARVLKLCCVRQEVVSLLDEVH